MVCLKKKKKTVLFLTLIFPRDPQMSEMLESTLENSEALER